MAPSGRAYWKGFLRLSLVSIGVEVFNAEDRRSEIHFNQIHKPTGKRINYTKTVQGVGPVQASDIVKGYEIDKDDYVVLEPEELEALRLESKRTVDLTQFASADDIDPRYFEQPYYLVPADEYAMEGYLVIREALRKTKKVGIGQITLAGREHLVAVAPLEQGLMMERLRYANEIKSSKSFFGDLQNPSSTKRWWRWRLNSLAARRGVLSPSVITTLMRSNSRS
jgi:DNA end-binding protein Ku